MREHPCTDQEGQAAKALTAREEGGSVGIRRNWRLRFVTMVAIGALVATACSSDGSTADSDGSTTAPADLQAVYAELEGLDAEARRARLIEMATAEEGDLTLYSAVNPDNLDPTIEAFQDDTGITVQVLAASDLASRILQEFEAGVVGADVVQDGAETTTLLSQEGVLSDLDTPIEDEIIESGRSDQWLASDTYIYLIAWNTDLVADGDQPTSYEDLFERFPGQFSIDSSDWQWFATLVTEYFEGQQGMTEEEGIAVVADNVQGAVVMADHTLGSELLAAGDYPVYPVMFHHYLPGFEEAGAPIAWEPAVFPMIAGFTALGITSNTDNPASALLLTEYQLTDAQAIYAEQGRTVTNTQYATDSATADFEIIPLSPELALDTEERTKWENIWTEIVQSTGTKPIEGES
jgi:ABC-type Fe3+ transport system substrate-binding protein